VAQDIHRVSETVPVKKGPAFRVPEAFAQGTGDSARLFRPGIRRRGIAPDPADLREGPAGSEAPAGNIHTGHGNDPEAFRGRILLPPAGGIPVPEGIVLPGIIDAEG
jgi:hypothetical protein